MKTLETQAGNISAEEKAACSATGAFASAGLATQHPACEAAYRIADGSPKCG
jgi:hypothetical protein